WKVYFLGAKEEVVSRMVTMYQKLYPHINIVGYRNGYWTEDEEIDVATAIKDAKPDLLFVAISSPKKENFLNQYQKIMEVPFVMGVGGTFDVMVGDVRRAPVWMQKTGFEWLYRFLQEPRRM